MPDILRFPTRMNCSGIDLVSAIDRMPPDSFPFLNNVRVVQEGRIESRPGYTSQITLNDTPNSIRRLNDPDKSFSPQGYIYVGGAGTNLYAGVESNFVGIDPGFSGNPLSLIPFRPDQSPESWMYVYDANKLEKIRPDKDIRPIGYAPPSTAPTIEYGVPATVDVSDGQTAFNWNPFGIDTGVSNPDRTNSSNPTIQSITYNSGPTGWCCINPVIIGQPFWVGERMKIVLNKGGGNEEVVVVRNVLPAIPATTVAGIHYDAGNTGPCSLVLTGSPASLSRNSLLQIDAEVVRVLEVNLGPNGTDYSIRCSTQNTHAVGAPVTGLVSWYVYTTQHHIAGESMASLYVFASHSSAGTGGIAKAVVVDASTANGRTIDPANDYLHVSFFLQDPAAVTNIQLLVSLDTTPNFSFTNPGNSFIWTIPQAALNVQGSSGDSWVDVVIPISQGVRSGSDLSRTLANITGLAIQLITTGACAWGFDWWYLFGTYGPTIQPNSPVGYVYQARFRDSTTGARSVPGPQTRYELFPLRESVLNTLAATSQAGVDSADIYRDGGTITSPLYVGTINGPGGSFLDTLPDSQVIETNQVPDLTALQPWPIEQLSWTGTCDVIGTTVIWRSGSHFNTALLSDTIITIDGVALLTYGQPRSTTMLELTQDGGNKTNVVFQVTAAILASQPLPFAFGPLEGPFAPTVFALGDPINGGLLYFSNFNDADSASDANTVELSTPSSSLVSGDVWNGMAFAGTEDDVFCVRFSYLTTIGASNSNSFQWARVNVPSGIWSRWACCACPIGLAYLGRDGIYLCTESAGKNISDDKLYPLFPHEGQPAKAVTYGDQTIYPVDMTKVNNLRLSYCDEELRFSYVDINGKYQTLIWQIYKNRWFYNTYADSINYHYLVELPEEGQNTQQILMLSVAAKEVVLAGGDTDNGTAITSTLMLPSDDSKDDRAQKLYMDSMIQVDGNGPITARATYNSATVYSPAQIFQVQGSISQFLLNLTAQSNLTLYRNIGALLTWTGGPSGPRVYAWDATGFAQPILTSLYVIQVNPFSFPGWKHMRRAFPALISRGEIDMTILCQDGRIFGPFPITSTAGLYRILPQILPQNIKDLAFSIQLDGHGLPFALFPQDFTIEVKEWTEETYIKLAVFRA